MRIGFDAKRAYQNYTGLGNYSRDLIRNLITYVPDNEYHLYAPKTENNPRLDFIKLYNNVFPHFPETPFHKTFKGIWRTLDLEKTLKKDNINIFHGLSNEIPKRGKHSPIKYVVTIHDLIFLRYPETYNIVDRKIYNAKFKYAANNADRIIAISEQTKEDIINFYNISSDKIDVIYQTCHNNFKKEYSREDKTAVKLKFNLPDRFMLNVGTIEARKNLNALVQAVPFMNNNLPIVVVGRKTKYMNFIAVQMEKLNIPKERFIFLDNVTIDELPAIYQMAELFVYPSVFEGFGIPIVEALYSKTPVITTQGSCFHEAGGKNSIYLDTQDHNLLAQTIDKLLEDQTKKNIMKEEGYKYVQRFDALLLTEQLIKLYNGL